MKKTNFQFYATHDEIRCFIDKALSTDDMHVCFVRLFPEYEVQEVTHNQRTELNGWTFALFSECRRELNTSEEYLAYSKKPHGDLIMYIGDETETELKESSIGVAAEHTINPKWLELISILQKNVWKVLI